MNNKFPFKENIVVMKKQRYRKRERKRERDIEPEKLDNRGVL